MLSYLIKLLQFFNILSSVFQIPEMPKHAYSKYSSTLKTVFVFFSFFLLGSMCVFILNNLVIFFAFFKNILNSFDFLQKNNPLFHLFAVFTFELDERGCLLSLQTNNFFFSR